MKPLSRLCVFSAFFLAIFHAQADTPPENNEQVEMWVELMESVQQAGVEFLRENPQTDELERAEGLLYVTQQLATSIQAVVAERDQRLPLLRLGATNIGKWGLDAPDAKYQGAFLAQGGAYKLSGTLGNARIISVQLVQDFPAFSAFGSVNAGELQADENGRFELLIAETRPDDWDGPWLQLDPAANRLLIREYFADWQSEHPSRFMLERIDDMSLVEPPLQLDALAAIMRGVEARFGYRLNIWQPWVNRKQATLVNKVRQLGVTGQGLQSNIYGEGWFRLEEDEILLIEFDAPDVPLWSFQLGNVWWESLDYVHRRGSINSEQAVVDSDGRVRLLITRSDPGFANWLDPGEHRQGAIMYRIQGAATSVVPEAMLILRSDLESLTPADSVRLTPEQRKEELTLRRAHVTRRWAP
jgi:hypothetical protein